MSEEELLIGGLRAINAIGDLNGYVELNSANQYFATYTGRTEWIRENDLRLELRPDLGLIGAPATMWLDTSGKH